MSVSPACLSLRSTSFDFGGGGFCWFRFWEIDLGFLIWGFRFSKINLGFLIWGQRDDDERWWFVSAAMMMMMIWGFRFWEINFVFKFWWWWTLMMSSNFLLVFQFVFRFWFDVERWWWWWWFVSTVRFAFFDWRKMLFLVKTRYEEWRSHELEQFFQIFVSFPFVFQIFFSV